MTAYSLAYNLVLTTIILWAVKTVISKLIASRQVLATIRKHPGGQILWIHPFRAITFLLGHAFPPLGHIGAFRNEFSLYQKYGSTCLSSIIAWSLTPVFWLADADAIGTVLSDRHAFPKDLEMYKLAEIYGENLATVDEADWKRHRNVAMPAFSEANISFVWSESIRVVHEWFDQLDTKDGVDTVGITIDTVAALKQVTLLVISSAGFSQRSPWTSKFAVAPTGYQLSFHSALGLVVDGLMFCAAFPKWFFTFSQKIYLPYLSFALKTNLDAMQELKLHILEMASTARARVAGGRASPVDAALLKNLVEANMAQEGDAKSLTDDELLSNIFAFFLAGHETSSHSLTFTVVLLALYPDVQRQVREEVARLWPEELPASGAFSSYKEDFPRLQYTVAVIRETLRCFPVVPRLSRCVQRDMAFIAQRFTPHPDGHNKHGNLEPFTVVAPAGSVVIVDILGTHMNALYWGDDVNEFKPERFIDSESYRWPRRAFLAFSAGPRSCIGERFAMSESVYIIAALVHRYEILVPDNLLSLSHEEQKKAMLSWTPSVTMTPTNAHVRLRRR